jgi:hypothetical protein
MRVLVAFFMVAMVASAVGQDQSVAVPLKSSALHGALFRQLPALPDMLSSLREFEP